MTGAESPYETTTGVESPYEPMTGVVSHHCTLHAR
jgi:hypothetical protein